MNASKIHEIAVEKFPIEAPAESLGIVEMMVAAKNLGNKTFDKIEAVFPSLNYGFFDCVKEVIKEEKAAQNYTPRSAQEARIDRIAYITDSNGKRTARRFN